jgi:glyoxylase-like metal-dependent hydrolase (beta-lactamase superfamily II)
MAGKYHAPDDLRVLCRGWLDGNVVLLTGRRPGDAPALIDSGYHSGAGALFSFIARHLGGERGALEAVALTHIHSDHAGGVAALTAGPERPAVLAHPDAAALVARWDPRALWLGVGGQRMPRFSVDRILQPGEPLDLGGHRWRVIGTPGHAVGGVSFLREHDGVLVTGDALWEDGFGILNPWIDGPGVFERAEQALDNLARLSPALVIPGHGPPFTDFTGALGRARSRLDYLRRNPARNRLQMLRNTLAFYRLAYPGRGRAHLEAELRRWCQHLPPLPGDPGGDEEALIAGLLEPAAG